MPERIQLRRTAGWRKPEGAIVVARPTKWGNPWRVIKDGRWYRVRHATDDRSVGSSFVPEFAYQTATRQFHSDLVNDRLAITVDDVERELAGHDLCCWCSPSRLAPNGSSNWLGLTCHADVLLELANA
jgi:hypothetical protein